MFGAFKKKFQTKLLPNGGEFNGDDIHGRMGKKYHHHNKHKPISSH